MKRVKNLSASGLLSAWVIFSVLLAGCNQQPASKGDNVAPKEVTSSPIKHTVEITNFEFEPSTLAVNIGDSVEFINRDVVPHTATDTDEVWDSQLIANAQSWTLVVEETSIGSYYCKFHPTMKGTLTKAE